MHRYSTDEIEYIRKNLPGISGKAFTDMFNRHFGLSIGVDALISTAKRYGVANGLDARFQKGQVSHNKGKKGVNYPGMKPTQFQKGHMPHNYRPVGSERVTVDGYIEIKVADPKKWRMKQVLVWEKQHGKIPKGQVVVFGDGNRQNCDIDNLLLISRAELAVMNKRGLCGGSKELTEAGRIVAQLRMGIHNRNKKAAKRRKHRAEGA